MVLYFFYKSKYNKMLTTIKDFCTARGVSRQHVYQEIKRGKHVLLELPIYVQHEEKLLKIGVQKFLKTDIDSTQISDAEWAKNTAKSASKDSEIRTQIEHLLSPNLTDSEKDSYKEFLIKIYAPPHPKHSALTAAFERLSEIMRQEMAQMTYEINTIKIDINAL